MKTKEEVTATFCALFEAHGLQKRAALGLVADVLDEWSEHYAELADDCFGEGDTAQCHAHEAVSFAFQDAAKLFRPDVKTVD